MLDKAIAVAVTLFILSMIAERFVTWMKIYFGKQGRSLLGFSTKDEDLRKPPRNDEEAKAREVKVLGLNIVLSVIIATVAHASLFDIMSNDAANKSIGWQNSLLEFSLKGMVNFFLTLLGCFLTGLFISLGSKFWHDMLDLLLYSKNLKQKLSEPATYEPTSVDQLTEYLDFTESDLVRLAIAQHEQSLKIKFPNIEFLNDSIAVINGERRDVMGIYLSDEITTGIPGKIPVRLPSGKSYSVTTEIISGIGSAYVTGGMEGSVSNADLFGFTGSACCIVEDEKNKNYMLTNCHVLTDGFVKSPLFKPGDHDVLYEDKKIGPWTFGSMDAGGDFALAEITDLDSFISHNDLETFTKTPREILKEDWLKLQVTARGNKCKTRKDAFIIEVVTNQLKVNYKNSISITYATAILVGDKPDKARSKPVSDLGDSGGAIYDDKMNLIGIITARGNNFSYVIPITNFLNAHNLKIK